MKKKLWRGRQSMRKLRNHVTRMRMSMKMKQRQQHHLKNLLLHQLLRLRQRKIVLRSIRSFFGSGGPQRQMEQG
ncbi:hypothetical protein BT93_H2026 [Corymbia citriodora subsp. variegata]|nr:hypothetical protein BT93_H2026 [Corymbia citriodora subsp. variegata]